MGAFFVYIVKSAVCLAVFYLFYRLLLSRETFHRFSRIALLGILILSCAIPFVEVTMKEPMEVSQQLVEAMGREVCLVQGNRENIKLTTPFDLKIAEVLI